MNGHNHPSPNPEFEHSQAYQSEIDFFAGLGQQANADLVQYDDPNGSQLRPMDDLYGPDVADPEEDTELRVEVRLSYLLGEAIRQYVEEEMQEARRQQGILQQYEREFAAQDQQKQPPAGESESGQEP